jgi:hypothetical protein
MTTDNKRYEIRLAVAKSAPYRRSVICHRALESKINYQQKLFN